MSKQICFHCKRKFFGSSGSYVQKWISKKGLKNTPNYIKYKWHEFLVLSVHKSYPSFSFLIKTVNIHDLQKWK